MNDLKPIHSDISFADSTLISFDFNEKSQILHVSIECWNEKIVELIFLSVVFFQYMPGDFISDIYEVENSSIVNDALINMHEKIPNKHNYRLILFNDINNFSLMKIVCNDFRKIYL